VIHTALCSQGNKNSKKKNEKKKEIMKEKNQK
jgi:hypothetical protein